jgi:hypothetical protein
MQDLQKRCTLQRQAENEREMSMAYEVSSHIELILKARADFIPQRNKSLSVEQQNDSGWPKYVTGQDKLKRGRTDLHSTGS